MSSRTSQAPTSGSRPERDSDSGPGVAWTRPASLPRALWSGLNCPSPSRPLASLPSLLIYFLSNWIQPWRGDTPLHVSPHPRTGLRNPGNLGSEGGEPGSWSRACAPEDRSPCPPPTHTQPSGGRLPSPPCPTHIPEVRAPSRSSPTQGCRATGLLSLLRQGLGPPCPHQNSPGPLV